MGKAVALTSLVAPWGLSCLLFAAACPGSTTPIADPCAGVSCATGRVCVNGACQAAPDQGPWDYPDSGWTPFDQGPRDGGPIHVEDGGADGGANDGAAPKPDLPPVEPDKGVPDTGAPDTGAPDKGAPVGAWYQANERECIMFCSTLGQKNVPSPNGNRCVSGELRDPSAIAANIGFTYGCWPNCAPQNVTGGASKGKFCYRPGQKDDNDKTDRTVGCFCQ